MSDRMYPIPFENIIEWIIDEYSRLGTIFGVRKFVHIDSKDKIDLFGEHMEVPFGPAAGPHTQLTQNIIASYVAGCRFFELKTVQTLDGEDLCVNKPCINARDEGYNVEWSTELTVEQALEEYVKAWFILKLLSKEYGFGDENGFIFNMSVGYDFEGISSPKIDAFIEGLKDASSSPIWLQCKEYTLKNINRFKNIDKEFVQNISPNICTSITLSTLHGCPPEEIERIASYLLEEKHLNTFVKCNPTLLGYDYARKTLDEMGYDYLVFDDFHFKDDLQYEDAVPMIKRLLQMATKNNLTFGVKLTNTFPVKIAHDELPGEEMYMSGRSLYPLSIALAYKLAESFNGNLKISYSGGADAYNIDKIAEAGIWPITIATTLLKNGGYERCIQLADKLRNLNPDNYARISPSAIKELKENAVIDPYYRKPIKPLHNNKINKKVPLVDCFISPCKLGCPINQEIPTYINLMGKGKYKDALKVIIDRNPLPFITGTICSHPCTTKCTRNFYEEYIKIRDVKLEAAKAAYNDIMNELSSPITKSHTKVAVIGGGPAGLAAGYFLGRCGMNVTIFEKRKSLGGIVKHVIPEFRISSDSIQKDIELIKKMGIEVKLDHEQNNIEELKEKGYKYILLAVGAWNPVNLRLENGNPIDALDFLENIKNGNKEYELGKDVVVIGGGNTAMDTARAAKRVEGVNNVYLIYRRTKKYMPADEEELLLATEDGVIIKELLSPAKFKKGKLCCEEMKLGEIDNSGRRKPIKTGNIVNIHADSIISAIGQNTDTCLFQSNGIKVENNNVIVNEETCESNIENVYVVGDALRGPSTVVESIADSIKSSLSIMDKENIKDKGFGTYFNKQNMEDAYVKKGTIEKFDDIKNESKRCLECNMVCETCVDVCPNRANISITVPGKSMSQIIHIDSLCNECGNCEVFCPYDSAPYKDKFTLFNTEKDFLESKNQGFYMCNNNGSECRIRLNDEILKIDLNNDHNTLPADIKNIITTVNEKYSFLMR
ncbi:putative selenate reductase subunit YgfK [Vallitalea guaymasensis]|uniref:dihydrouracil dehydrogenase (NAD(+)) n=1 Tax=Vallitalea guaymasensis TaxID=1185412 RepID=A0A8J8MFG9_9FIRM|nr:putative selenate reductase subunit YgfK [Vallitalea guaymasensis]QUH31680.1 putative selenate reductase subunit YgfK [Vallitalea guaymasensis]